MRVLHIGKYYPPFAGGMEYFAADLMRVLCARGIEVAALVHAHGPPRRSPDYGSEPESFPWPVERAPSYGRLLFAPLSPRFPRFLERTIERFQPDILHLHVPNTSAFWALALPAARAIPWLVHWHADVGPGGLNRALRIAYACYGPLERRLLDGARAIIATSPPYLDSSAALAARRDKCRMIPLGVDPDRLPPPEKVQSAAAARLWPAPDALRVLCVGRLTYYKGYRVLLRALAAAPGVQVCIVGAGQEERRLRKSIGALGLHDRVALIGCCDEAMRNALLAGCEVFCLPSLERTEAFGLVLLEAMRYGKPLLASDIPGAGVGWVIRRSGAGRLCPPGDPTALARALNETAACRGERERWGQAGERCFREHFHIEGIGAQVAALYGEILNGL